MVTVDRITHLMMEDPANATQMQMPMKLAPVVLPMDHVEIVITIARALDVLTSEVGVIWLTFPINLVGSQKAKSCNIY